MIKIDFTETNEVRNTELFQFDYGQILEISGVELPEKFEMHFEYGDISLSVDGIYSDGKGTVKVPDTLLDGLRSKFSAWLYVENGKSGKTLKTVEFILGRRKKPSDYPCNPSEIAEVKTLAEYVKENADKVATAEKVGQDLLQRAENGEFDGADYILTETDKAEIAEAIPVDAELSETSTKPLQNKVVKEHFDKVQDILADGKLKDIICFTSKQEAIDGHYLEYVRDNEKIKQELLDKEFYIVIIATEYPMEYETGSPEGPVYYWGAYVITKTTEVNLGFLDDLVYLSTNTVYKSEFDKLLADYERFKEWISALFQSSNMAEAFYPIGIIVPFADNLDHSSFLGFTWERCLVGRTPVGIDINDTDFSEIGKQLGEKTHLLTDTEAPKLKPRGSTSIVSDNDFAGPSYNGTGEPHNNIQPSEVVAFWKRVK